MSLVIKGSSSGQVTIDVPAAAGTNTITLPASTFTVPTSGGTVLQVAADEITAEVSGSGAFQNIGLEVTITPSSTSSKILLFTTGGLATNGTGFGFKFTQDGSDVGVGDAPTSNTNRIQVSFKGMSSNGNRTANFAGSTILSPSSTSALTYRVQVEAESDGTWYLNRAWHASNSSDVSHAVSASYFYAIELNGDNTTIST